MTNKALIKALRHDVEYLNNKVAEKDGKLLEAYSEIARRKKEDEKLTVIAAEREELIEQLKRENRVFRSANEQLQGDLAREKRITDGFITAIHKVR